MEVPRGLHEAEGPAPVEVTVPFQDRPLVPVCPDRVRALRRHLVESMRALREARPVRSAPESPPQPEEAARITCSLCRGHCCKGGGTHGYLDEQTMARVRAAHPEADAMKIMRLYVAAVAPVGVEGSCLFHGPAGCTLPRALRSDLCNRYVCNGLRDLLQALERGAPVRVSAGRGGSFVARPDGSVRFSVDGRRGGALTADRQPLPRM